MAMRVLIAVEIFLHHHGSRAVRRLAETGCLEFHPISFGTFIE
jgi:hypothetical protein